MQVDTVADGTVISWFIWNGLGEPQLDAKTRRLEAYVSHQMALLGSITRDVEWNVRKYMQQQLAIVKSDK